MLSIFLKTMSKFIQRRILLILVTGALGMTVEIAFTAFSDPLFHPAKPNLPLTFRGYSYPWMFPVYASAGILFPWAMSYLKKIHLLLRAVCYVVGIYGIEFLAGLILTHLTGACPWEYRSGYHIEGFIKLDYALAWYIFGIGMERFIRWWHSLMPYLDTSEE